MRRRDLIAVIFMAPMMLPLRTSAQSSKTYRIGVLETISAEQNSQNFDALEKGLRDRGFVEENNLRFEYRSADGHGG